MQSRLCVRVMWTLVSLASVSAGVFVKPTGVLLSAAEIYSTGGILTFDSGQGLTGTVLSAA